MLNIFQPAYALRPLSGFKSALEKCGGHLCSRIVWLHGSLVGVALLQERIVVCAARAVVELFSPGEPGAGGPSKLGAWWRPLC